MASAPLNPQEQAELEQLRAESAKPSDAPSKPSLEDLIRGRIPQDVSKLADATSGHGNEIVQAAAANFIPAGKGLGLTEWLGSKAGKVPDYLMQKAVGMKKYIPGVGSELLDQGIMGSKGQMRGQIGSALDTQGQRLENAVQGLDGTVDSQGVADKVSGNLNKYSTSTGIVPEQVRPEFDRVSEIAGDIADRGPVSPKDALKLKRIAGSVGYKEGNPLTKLDSRLAQDEGAEYGGQLEKLYSDQNPGLPNQVQDANSKLTALLRGQKALSTPETITKSSLLGDAVAGGAGMAVGGPAGAAAGVAVRRLAQTPLVQSVGAQGLQKTGQALGRVAPAIATRSAVGMASKSPGMQPTSSPTPGSSTSLSPEEQAELEQLRKELK